MSFETKASAKWEVQIKKKIRKLLILKKKLHLTFFLIYWHQNDKATEPKWDKVSWRKNKNGHLWGFLWGHKPTWMAISAKVTLFYSIFPCFKGFVFSSGQCSLSFFLEYQHQSKCHFSGDIFSFILLRIFLSPPGGHSTAWSGQL